MKGRKEMRHIFNTEHTKGNKIVSVYVATVSTLVKWNYVCVLKSFTTFT
jgi:hypothetical protein